jgi:hypothetical protein
MSAAAGGAILLAGAGPANAAGAAVPAYPAPPQPSLCSGVLRVDSFAFDPPSVSAGGSSAAALTVRNCTGQTQAVTETWTGRFSTDTGTGIPPGCPALDPLPRPVTLAPRQRNTTATTYIAFASCAATHLTVTVTITQGATQLARTSAVLTIV